MSQATLKTVTLETLATAAKAAEQAVDAYRAGGRRLVATLDERVTQRAAVRAERYAPKLAAALRQSSTRANTWAVKRIEAVSQRTDALITASSAQVAAQVRRLARVADGVQNPVVAKGLDAAARATLPGAKVALALTERVAAAADKLPGAAKKASRRAGAKPATATQAVKATRKAAKAGADAVTQALAKPVGTRRAAAKPATSARALKKATAQATELATAQVTKARRAVKKAADEATAAAKPAVRAARKQVKAAVKPVVEAMQDVQAAA